MGIGKLLAAIVWGSVGLLIALILLNVVLKVVQMVPGTAGAVATGKRWAGLSS